MLTVQEMRDGWAKIVEIYKDNRDDTNRPDDAMNLMLDEFGYDKVREIFATIGKIKEHDGRIWGKQREFVNETATNPEITYMSRIGHLNDIHTAHINQLIGELMIV